MKKKEPKTTLSFKITEKLGGKSVLGRMMGRLGPQYWTY